jgi:phospholipase/lecithinase/hemolysin
LSNGAFPLPPYYAFRFSNGPTWIENFPAKELIDYAYGGAVVNQLNSGGGPPSLMAQINDYLIGKHFNVSGVADETLYVFWGGSNDIFALLANTSSVTSTGVNTDLLQLAVTMPWLIANQIGKLIKAGAKNILIMLIPTSSNTPLAATLFDTSQLTIISAYTQGLNDRIVANVSAIVPPTVNLKFFDTLAFTQTMLSHPRDFDLVNVTSPCLANYEVFLDGVGGQTPIICSNPNEYLYWDGSHPTAKVHAVYASEVERYIGWGQYCESY